MPSSENQAAASSQVCHSCSFMQHLHSHVLEFRVPNTSAQHIFLKNTDATVGIYSLTL